MAENPPEPPVVETAGPSARRRVVLAVLVILAAGTALRMRDFFQPWKNTDPSLVLKGFGGALYSTMARNHLRYGYRKTRLAMITCGGERTVNELANHRYLNHPPLYAVLLSLSFRLFGVHEWSARLVPLVFSALSLLLLFVVVRRVAGTVPALVAMLLMAAMPMAVYYGTFVEVQSFQVMFISLVIFDFYWRWRASRRVVFLGALLVTFLIGAGLDWPVYLLALGVFLHHLIAPGERGRSKGMLAGLAVAAVVAFGLTLAHVYLLSGRDLRGLVRAIQVETVGPVGVEQFREHAHLWPGRLEHYFLRMYTLPLMILAAVWIVRALLAGLVRRAPAGSGLVFCYVLMGAGYVVLFPTGSYTHEYWSMYLIPALAVAAALLVCEASPWTTGVAALALAVHLGVLAWHRYEPLVPYDSSYYVRAGHALQENTAPADTVAVLAIGTEEFFYAYYGDRTVNVLEPEALLARPERAGKIRGRWVAVPANLDQHPLSALKDVAAHFREARDRLVERLSARARPVAAGPLLLFPNAPRAPGNHP